MTRFLASLSATAFAIVTACSSNGGPTAIGPPTVSREWVTGAAAEALGPNGRFVFPHPPDGGSFAITEANAREQAVAWARLVATTSSGSALEQDFGGKIPFADLRDCHSAVFAQSAYGPLPDTIPRWLVNAYGPYWLVRLCAPSGDIPVVVAVSVTSEFSVADGQLEPPLSAATMGNEFRTVATPRGTSPFRLFPLEPEAAVAFAFRKTGRRVSEVPRFVQRVADYGRPDPFYAQFGYWRLTLESSVHGVGTVSGAEYDTRQVAVYWPGGAANDTTLQVALAAQTDTALYVPYTVPDTGGGQPTRATVRVPVRAPYLFEPLRVSRR